MQFPSVQTTAAKRAEGGGGRNDFLEMAVIPMVRSDPCLSFVFLSPLFQKKTKNKKPQSQPEH